MRSGPRRATPAGVRTKAGASQTSRLRAALSRFLHRRRRLGHFGRHPLQDALAGRGRGGALPDPITQDLLEVARDEPSQALRRLHSRPEGLSPREAAARLARHGPNLVEHEGPLPWWRHLWHCFLDPFNLLLTALAAVSWATHDLKATVVISTMVALSTALRFVQEHRSSRAAESL
jgi:Mg2+-importing ATPase